MIRIENLKIIYGSESVAISGLTLDIKKGSRTAVIGANGAGKSTLLLSIMGILPIEEGTIYVDDLAVTKKSAAEIRKKCGIVFQNPDEQLFTTKVYDDVAFGPKNHGLKGKKLEDAVMGALGAMGISHLKDRIPMHLSGGEKRAVAVASVLSMDPQVLLLDEPSSFLDPRSKRTLIKTLSNLCKTQVIATHDLDLARKLCDTVVLLKDGKLCACGSAGEILENERLLIECGL